MSDSPAFLAYEAALPDDPRVTLKQMFGGPCAFVNRQMFFGTFEDTLVARIGPKRVAELAGQDGMRVFTLSPEKTWDDYVQFDPTTDPDRVSELAAEALEWAAALPKKLKWPKDRSTRNARRNKQKKNQ